jgi:hypothetical protein
MGRILIAGGVHDPNIDAILRAAENRGVETIPLLIGEDRTPSLTWDLDAGSLQINGNQVRVTALFARRDAFHAGGAEAEYRSLAWFTTLQGWLATSPRIRTLNRHYIGRHTNKLEALHRARAAGLKVPATLVTNDLDRLGAFYKEGETIAKPVPGGGYSELVQELLAQTEFRDGAAATPAIVQPRLQGPDLRIYGLDKTYFGFYIHADAVDYRRTQSRRIERATRLPDATLAGLERLMDSMGLDWGAADFKLDPESNEPVFLEINSQPMFSAFNRLARGAITDAIITYLLRKSADL